MADFQEKLQELSELGVSVYALSVDSAQDASDIVSQLGLGFAVGYGLDSAHVADETGAFRDAERGHLQATAFILRDGKVVHSTYSSGPVGRLQALHAIGLIQFAQQQQR